MTTKSSLALLLLLPALACSPADRADTSGDPDASTVPPGADATPGFVDAAPPAPVFPTAPIIDPGAPANAGTLFGEPGVGVAGGPCVSEPEPGTLVPLYWLRQRFTLDPAGAENLFELRLHVDSEPGDLVVYTTHTTWTIPADLWKTMNQRLADQTITFSVRGGQWNGTTLVSAPTLGTSGTFRIAPVTANGSIVYWTNGVDAHSPAFKGFTVGDESVQAVLTQPQAEAVCVGCHSSTPDGKFVAFSSGNDAVRGDFTHIDLRTVDGTVTRPPFLSAAASTLLARQPNQEQPSFSPAHWQDGDHKMISMFPVDGVPALMWTDLEATSTERGVGWGVLARTGDIGQAGAASWSHDGTRVAYSSGPLITSGINLDDAHGDIYTVPWADGAGGVALPLPGASSPSYTEHYAAFAADDRLLAFVRLDAAQNPYSNPETEVFVVPAEGGTPVRLRANDPPVCSGRVSPGVSNTWPKWSPRVEETNGKRYYWLTFSSARTGNGVPQIYVAPIVVDETGNTETFPALYLWNQPASEHNHTPAWDTFAIPPID